MTAPELWQHRTHRRLTFDAPREWKALLFMDVMRQVRLGTAFGLLVFVAGCSGASDIKLVDQSGKVTFAGQPVVYGSIEFVPDTEKEHKGPAGFAEIIEGSYDTRKGGRGVVSGPHKVRVTAYDENPPPANPDETVPSTAKPPIFAGYTLDAELTGGQKDFDIPESAKGFDIFKSAVPKRSANDP
jgi:hypothetical protein